MAVENVEEKFIKRGKIKENLNEKVKIKCKMGKNYKGKKGA